MPLLSPLNDPQRRAVCHGEGPLLVLAGAGSGKTRVIVHRIAWLIRERSVFPSRILAVTFTNKAAGEMRHRVEELLGGGDLPQIGTFHAICARILRRDAELLGYSPNFAIYDDKDSERLLREVCRDLGVDERKYPVRAIAAAIDDRKNEGMLPHEWEVSDPHAGTVRTVYTHYQKRLKSANALDFGDLVMLAVRLLRDHPPVLERYRNRWEWILVDEYQDTNRVQYELIRLLAGERQNLCVVGDDDQSIYRWRGADIRNILEFERDFPDVTVVKLEQNYRSTRTILSAAGAVVAKNRGRRGKTLWTDNPSGDPVVYRRRDDDWDEARFVAREIGELVSSGEDPGEIAVFYRTNAQSRVLEEVLLSEGIDYRVVGGFRFYDRQEIRDMVAYLRLIANPADEVSLRRIINVPDRRIGEATLEHLASHARQRGISLHDALLEVERVTALRRPAVEAVRGFVSLVERYRERSGGEPPSRLLASLVDETGYRDYLLRRESPLEVEERMENVRALIVAMEEYEERQEGGLEGFLEQVSLMSDHDRHDDGQGRVALMTFHAAKGLEFEIVFMVGMEEGLFPLARAAEDPEQMEEERRLCYVGMTRARRKLYLLNTHRRRLYGRGTFNPPSRFIDDIPPDCLDPAAPVRRNGQAGMTTDPPPFVERVDQKPLAPTRSFHPPGDVGHNLAALVHSTVSLQGEPVAERPDRIGVGSRVSHPLFGAGTVRKIEGKGADQKAIVWFDSVGPKKLLLRFAGLTRL